MAPRAYAPTRKTLNQNDLFSAATVVCTAGTWQPVGSYTVPAGQGIRLGYGASEFQDSAEGRAYLIAKTATPTEVVGEWRIDILHPNGDVLHTLFRERAESVNANATDRTKQLPFRARGDVFGMDYKVQLSFLADATATITKADSSVRLDCTMYKVDR